MGGLDAGGELVNYFIIGKWCERYKHGSKDWVTQYRRWFLTGISKHSNYPELLQVTPMVPDQKQRCYYLVMDINIR